MTGMMHSERRRPTCCKCYICRCKCHRKMTPKQLKRWKRDNKIILSILAALVLLLIGDCSYMHYHPNPVPQICLQTETVPHVEKHYTSTGSEYKTLEYKCIKSV